jgi:hypothetical protein
MGSCLTVKPATDNNATSNDFEASNIASIEEYDAMLSVRTQGAFREEITCSVMISSSLEIRHTET